MKIKLILTLVLFFLLAPAFSPATAATCRDLPDSERYSFPYIVSVLDNDVMDLSGESFRPDDPVTYVEANEFIMRAVGVTVDENSSNAPLTREDAFAMLAKAILLDGGNPKTLNVFSDGKDVSPENVQAVAALAESGYIKGSGGYLMPLDYMTREQFATMLGRIFGEYVNVAGTYMYKGGNVTVRAQGAEVKNASVTGDIFISGSVGEGDVYLNRVRLNGRLVIRGGGVNSIHITGGSKIESIIVAKEAGAVRVSFENSFAGTLVAVSDGVIVDVGKKAQIESLVIDGKDYEIVGSGTIKSANVSDFTLYASADVAADTSKTESKSEEISAPTGSVYNHETNSNQDNTADTEKTADAENTGETGGTDDSESDNGNTDDSRNDGGKDEGTIEGGSDDENDKPKPVVTVGDGLTTYENPSENRLVLVLGDKELIMKAYSRVVVENISGDIKLSMDVEFTKGDFVLTGDAIRVTLSGNATVLNNSGQYRVVNTVYVAQGGLYCLGLTDGEQDEPPEEEEPPQSGDVGDAEPPEEEEPPQSGDVGDDEPPEEEEPPQSGDVGDDEPPEDEEPPQSGDVGDAEPPEEEEPPQSGDVGDDEPPEEEEPPQSGDVGDDEPPEEEEPPQSGDIGDVGDVEPPEASDENELPQVGDGLLWEVLDGGMIMFDEQGCVTLANNVVFLEGDFVAVSNISDVRVEGTATLKNETPGIIVVNGLLLFRDQTIAAGEVIY